MNAPKRRCEGLHVRGGAKQARVTHDLRDRRRVACDDWRAAGHRLEHAVAEALVERGIEERGRATVEGCELLIAHASDELGSLARCAGPDDEDRKSVV